MEYQEPSSAAPMNYVVCHDGSEASEQALKTITKGLLRKEDHLNVATAWSHEKEEYLPYNYKLEYIRDQITTNHLYLGDRFKFIDQEIKKNEKAKGVLNSIAKDYKADITVVGFHGRKGPKDDPTVMGSAV